MRVIQRRKYGVCPATSVRTRVNKGDIDMAVKVVPARKARELAEIGKEVSAVLDNLNSEIIAAARRGYFDVTAYLPELGDKSADVYSRVVEELKDAGYAVEQCTIEQVIDSDKPVRKCPMISIYWNLIDSAEHTDQTEEQTEDKIDNNN